MGPEPLLSLLAIIPVALAVFYSYTRYRVYGNLPITTTSVAYDRAAYGRILDWDKHVLIIHGVPTQIFSGEFHYWRLPDRSRWETILKKYRTAGLNTIRIYFHWGFHSPSEGHYNFEGNRDIEYLLNLCERLGLYVMAAPGPYICAETQAGGFPTWLIAKRNIRIRHNKIMLWRTYDPEFTRYERQWFDNILPIIGRHQITRPTAGGCVIAVQIENELFGTLKQFLPVGLHDHMRTLARAARDNDITVPLFTNDGFEEGSWIAKPDLDALAPTRLKPHGFGIDLYGFDKYVVFVPSSTPTSYFVNNEAGPLQWPPWSPATVKSSLDGMERKVRGFGHDAEKSPIMIPELQGGWFNHYQLNHTYDDIYRFYGAPYTRMILESVLAQGVGISSLYMFYGGTNWGTIGDPDVYTSYDYSACIRESGFISDRLRLVRLPILFSRSFRNEFVRTERVKHPSVKASISDVINLQRRTVDTLQNSTNPAAPSAEFTFLRNFNKGQLSSFDLQYSLSNGMNFSLPATLQYKSSFIALGNYMSSTTGVHLALSSLPIHLRLRNMQDEIWVVELNGLGRLAFYGSITVEPGTLATEVEHICGNMVTTIEFPSMNPGWTKISHPGGTGGSLWIVGLPSIDVATLYAHFEEPYWFKIKNENKNKTDPLLGPNIAAWGVYSAYHDRIDSNFEIEFTELQDHVHILSFVAPKDHHFRRDVNVQFKGMPFIYTRHLPESHPHRVSTAPSSVSSSAVGPLLLTTRVRNFQTRSVNFSAFDWQPLLFKKGTSRPLLDAIDLHYTSGHILYRATFRCPSAKKHIYLTLNVRNRVTIYLNYHLVGGHTTYSRQIFMAGAKIGPDPTFLGSKTYSLDKQLHETVKEGEPCELLIIVDSFGMSRQAFIMNDVRNPRGLLSAKIKGLESHNTPVWSVTGVDISEIEHPFASTGFPREEVTTASWLMIRGGWDLIDKNGGPRWVRFEFDRPLHATKKIWYPLRLHLSGSFTAYIFLDSILIGRYYGNGDSPQHDFYLMDGLLKDEGNVVKMLVYSWETVRNPVVQVGGWLVEDGWAGSGNLVKGERGGWEVLLGKDTVKV